MKTAWNALNIAVNIFIMCRIVGVLVGFFDYADKIDEFLLKFIMGVAVVGAFLKLTCERLEKLTK